MTTVSSGTRIRFQALRRLGDNLSVWVDWSSPTFSERLHGSGLIGLAGALIAVVGGFGVGAAIALGDASELGRAGVYGLVGIPLYTLGYWQATSALRFSTPRLAIWIFALGGTYATLATAYHLATSISLQLTLDAGAALPEPSVQLLQWANWLSGIALLGASACFVFAILLGPSAYPRWALALNPALLTAAGFVLAELDPERGTTWIAVAPHAAHALFFLATTVLLWGARPR